MTSSELSNGMTAFAPLASAAATVVEARSTSIDEHDASLHVRRRHLVGREENVEPHYVGSFMSCPSRSRNFVSTSPAWKLRMRHHAARNGIVVVTPSMMKLSSATCMRVIASSRSRPWQMSLASSES